MQISRYRIKLNRLNHIFISHLHGDHYLGLVGLLSTMHLHHREADLTIFGPAGLAAIITLHLKLTEMVLNYKVHFVSLDPLKGETLVDNDVLKVTSIPLNHRIACTGFLFKEKEKKRRLNKEKDLRSLSIEDINTLRAGNDVMDQQGNIKYSLKDYTLQPRKARSFAYCSDTRYDERIIPYIQEVDLLYHESTFLHDLKQRAHDTFHSTAMQAASIAQKAGVGRLILGHFSIRYKELQPLLDEAREVFVNTILAIEGEKIHIEV